MDGKGVAVKRILLAGLLVAGFAVSPRPAPASCAPPSVAVAERTAKAGTKVHLTGEAWVDGCADSGSCGPANACGETECNYGPPVHPIEDIEISLEHEGESIPLATADAGPRYGFRVTAIVPEDTPPGRYRLIARAEGWDQTYDRIFLRVPAP